MEHYLTYRSVLKSRFGRPVIKVPVNGGFSCPNRDGTKSSKGCFFCDNRSFSPAARQSIENPAEQLRRAIGRLQGGKESVFFLPYLQPFSNTYGSVDELKEIYEPLLALPGVVGLSIGTRPDCFSEEIYRYIAEIAKRSYISIELGLQSSHNTTLDLCNRSHTFEDFVSTVARLSTEGVETVAHVILGLPGETEEMMFETAQKLAELPCCGVKIHQLMVIEGTEFSRWYREGRLAVCTIEQYTKLLCGFLSYLRPDQHIHRIVADSTLKYGLIAPLWSAEKRAALKIIHEYMDKNETRQGSNCIYGRAKG